MKNRAPHHTLQRWRHISILLPFVLAALVILWWPTSQPWTPTEREIALDATQFEFSPSRLTVNQGDRVVITLTASDVVHGFYLDGYGLKTRVEPGIAQRVEFIADQSGKFRYRCAVSCGPLHPFMIGELVVSPNNPFWKAIALMLIASTGLLAYLYKFGKRLSYEQSS
jgi:heme/copper-type cytochrome/quinol oxidase subunit 2